MSKTRLEVRDIVSQIGIKAHDLKYRNVYYNTDADSWYVKVMHDRKLHQWNGFKSPEVAATFAAQKKLEILANAHRIRQEAE